jgi:glycosyltransferase involved in cell wall biosynthesis
MKILWIDPVNCDPQFLNAMAQSMAHEGHEVIVRSNSRNKFTPPICIKWSSFSMIKKFPQTLERKIIWRFIVAMLYPFDWFRAVRFAKYCNVESVIITTKLAIPSVDTWGLRMLRRAGIATVILVHKPYPNFFKDPDKLQSHRYRSFYNETSKLLVLTSYTKKILQDLYGLPDNHFVQFAHPHFSNLLADTPPLLNLRNSLKIWASTFPVVAYISNISTERGIETFLSSLSILRNLVPDIRILLVSRLPDISKRQHIVNRINDSNLSKQCFFHWESYSYSELLEYLAVTTTIVAPYNYATQSGVIALAAGFGIPVVASSVGGLPEMVISGKTGEIVPPQDPQALAYAISKVVDPNSIDMYKKYVADHANTYFSPKSAAQSICKCLNEVKISFDEGAAQ